jgi:bifunctional non-homologous end joining protein LigD
MRKPPAPMLAVPVEHLPEGDDWAYELKWDGYRTITTVDKGKLRLTSRRGLDATAKYPEVAGIVEALGGLDAILDGELVVLDDEGRPSFQAIQQHERGAVLMLFDVLELDGRDVMALPWHERRALLERLKLSGSNWQTPRAVVGDSDAMLTTARELKFEGVVAKRIESPYRPGKRSSEWRKFKLSCAQEFVVGGWLPGNGRLADTLGSFFVGYYEDGALRYAGRVGSGLKDAQRDELARSLKQRDTSPFVNPPRVKNAVWVEPTLVIQVKFTEWTDEGILRQPTFVGMRDDKLPTDVVRET